jgi:hypothetical protein
VLNGERMGKIKQVINTVKRRILLKEVIARMIPNIRNE